MRFLSHPARSALGRVPVVGLVLVFIFGMAAGQAGARESNSESTHGSAAGRTTRSLRQTHSSQRSSAARLRRISTTRRTSVRPRLRRSYRHRYRRHYYRRHRVRLPAEPAPGRIEQIQSALARGGYYQSEPSGRWDAQTQDALRHFQESNGIQPTGKLDAVTLQKLGLGSDVAGLSAPQPTAPASSSTDQTTASPKPPNL